MATKWKNKIGLVVWLLLLTFGISAAATGVTNISSYAQMDYFKSQEFGNTLGNFYNMFQKADLRVDKIEAEKKAITVSPDEINEYRHRHGDLPDQISNIRQQYEDKINRATAEGHKDVADVYMKERDAKIADITKNFTDDAYVIEKIKKEKEKRINEGQDNYGYNDNRGNYKSYQNSLSYYFEDHQTGKVYTNVSIKEGEKVEDVLQSTPTYFQANFPNQASIFTRLNNEASSDRVSGYIAVPSGLSDTSVIMQRKIGYEKRQLVYLVVTVLGLVALALSYFLYRKTKIVDLSFVSGIKEKSDDMYRKTKTVGFSFIDDIKPKYDKIPIDVRLFVFGFTLIIGYMIVPHFYFGGYDGGLWNELRYIFGELVQRAIVVGAIIIQWCLLLPYMKEPVRVKQEWETAYIHRIMHGTSKLFRIKSVGWKIVIVLGLAFLAGVGIVGIFIFPPLLFIYIPAVLFIAIPVLTIIVKRAGYFNEIVTASSYIAEGTFKGELEVKGKTPLAILAKNINQLKEGVQSSQQEQVKSERLKTELITNVSHDLRTPLTSIITYTDLLKSDAITEDERQLYLEIVDRKSKRLKVLIEDLFEASKMASGNLELHKEKVDIVQLLKQSLAEHDEEIQESALQFKVTHSDSPVYAVVDGRQMWRVFDNLLGNILKYALENTRVFVSVIETNDSIAVTFKNVSKYDLDDNVDELFERFKRGDDSRHTEGSGLGLAIAKSIVDLHGGNLNIEVDGDLFKTTVTLNK